MKKNKEVNKEVNLDQTINKINNLTNETEKKLFDKNFLEVKNEIKLIEEVLDQKPEISDDLTLDKLFEMLQEYNNYIENDMSINVIEFKKIKDIIELIEKKMSDAKVNIIEIK